MCIRDRIYIVSAVVTGVAFLWFAVELLREPTPKNAMRLFTYSITYLTVLFAAMAVDQLVRSGL